MSEWYYMSGGQQHGPVSAAQLKSLASAGSLAPEDLVWNQSMPEWVAARRVRGLPFAGGVSAVKTAAPVRAAARAAAASAPAPAPAPVAVAEPEQPPQAFEPEQAATPFAPEEASSPAETYQAPSEPSKTEEEAPPARAASSRIISQRGTQVPPQAVDLFAKTRSPVLLISFLMFFLMLAALAATAFAALVNYDKAGKILTPALKAQGTLLRLRTELPFLIIYGAYALMALIMMVLLGKYSSRIKKLTATLGSEELERTMRVQTSLWKFIMLVMLITIALAVVRHFHLVKALV